LGLTELTLTVVDTRTSLQWDMVLNAVTGCPSNVTAARLPADLVSSGNLQHGDLHLHKREQWLHVTAMPRSLCVNRVRAHRMKETEEEVLNVFLSRIIGEKFIF